MALTITDRMIRSTCTRHAAELVHCQAGDAWRVSWLPFRLMDKADAVAAMQIADLVGPHGRGIGFHDDPMWTEVDQRAAALGMSGPNAVSRASEGPEDAAERAADEAGQ